MTFPKHTISVAAFIKRHWEGAKEWHRDSLLPWVQWYVNNKRSFVVADGEKIQAVALTRFVNTVHEAEEEYCDTNGNVVHCDLAVSRHSLGMKGVFTLMILQHGKGREFLSWTRNKYNNRISIQPMARMIQKLMIQNG